jgi:hypothetical protein
MQIPVCLALGWLVLALPLFIVCIILYSIRIYLLHEQKRRNAKVNKESQDDASDQSQRGKFKRHAIDDVPRARWRLAPQACQCPRDQFSISLDSHQPVAIHSAA